jgi:5-methylcytosine-specific restriction protein A
MPYKIGKACAVPGCSGIATRNAYCEAHQYIHKKIHHSEVYYGGEWSKISKSFLQKNPFCELCGAKSQIAHHIVEREDGGEDVEENLLAVCNTCHNKLHAKNKLHHGKKYTY